MVGHEGSTRPDRPGWGWDCRCGDTRSGFPSQAGAEDDLRIHLALDDVDRRGPVERLAAYVALYHPSSYVGAHLRRALRIAQGIEPVPAAHELTEDERETASLLVLTPSREAATHDDD